MTAALTLPDRSREQLEGVYAELMWRAMKDDFQLFAKVALMIEDKSSSTGYAPFDLLPHQVTMAEALCADRMVINLKGRQLGISTLVLGWMTWRLATTPGWKGLVLSHTDDYAKASIERIRAMFLMMPDWIRRRLPSPNDASGSFILDFGSGVKSVINAMPVTRKVGASLTLDFVLFDEAALAEYAGEAYATLKPTLDAASKNDTWRGAVIAVVSTARGSSNWFAQMWRKGLGFTKLFFPWSDSPYYTQEQYEQDLASAIARGEEHLHYQERPAYAEEAFRKSGKSRFSGLPDPDSVPALPLRGRLVHQLGEAGDSLAFEPHADGLLALAELPVPGRKYVVHVDPSSGKGLDYTVATVVSYDEAGLPYVAGRWRANDVEPYAAAEEFFDLGQFFAYRGRPALLSVETQGGWGATAITVLRGKGYRNLYRQASTTTARAKPRLEYGLPMGKATRPKVIDLLAQLMPDLGGLDPVLLSELHTFVVRDDGTMRADTGAHDDTVMSLAGALWVLHTTTSAGGTAPSAGMGEEPAVDETGEVLTLRLTDLDQRLQRERRAHARAQRAGSTRLRRAMRGRR